MIRIQIGKNLRPPQTLQSAWFHGAFEGCPERGDERVDVCLKRQETPSAVMCCNDRCDIGLKVRKSMGNLSVFEIRRKVGDV